MTKNTLSPKYYVDKNVYEKDTSQIFKKNWIFLTSNTNIKSPFYFPNLYNLEDLDILGIKQPMFKFLDQFINPTSKFLIQTCGSLYFINFDIHANSLEKFLSPSLYKTLEVFSESWGENTSQIYNFSKSNWKLNVENAVEDYHVATVHPQSYGSQGGTPLKHLKTKFNKMHSQLKIRSAVLKDLNGNEVPIKAKDLPIKINGYYFQHVFPNLTIATFYGIGSSIIAYYPVDMSKTLVNFYSFFAKNCKLKNMDRFSINAFCLKLMAEDILACERVQESLYFNLRDVGSSGAYEHRLQHFQESYLHSIV